MGTHSEGGVCAGEDIVELEECLCWCQNEETCSAVDWNKSDNPYKGCRCWWLPEENQLAPKTNEFVDQWTKQQNNDPEIAADPEIASEESGSVCDIVFGYGFYSTGDQYTKTYIGDADTPEECASLVFTQYPEATSMSYDGDTKKCYADLNTGYIYDYYSDSYYEYSCMNPELYP